MPNNLDGHTYETDEHGEYDVDAGSTSPVEGRCNAVLKYTMERYGEVRYCTAMPERTFVEDGSRFCRHHKAREALMKQSRDSITTGAFVKSYKTFFEVLPVYKRIIAINLYADLAQESTYDFEEEVIDLEIDTSEVDWYNKDTAIVEFPVPTKNTTRAKALWLASLSFIKMENIEERIFRDAFETKHATGERIKVVAAPEGGPIRDRAEHHLNLPLSRIMKDYKDHMKFGGVPMSKDGDEVVITEREWHLKVGPEAQGRAPEQTPEKEEDPFDQFVPED